MTIFEGIEKATIKFTDFQRKLVVNHRTRVLVIRVHKAGVINLRENITREGIELLKNEVLNFKRYLNPNGHESEGLTYIQEIVNAENKTFGALESDIFRLREQISELPVGDARNQLLLLTKKIENIEEPMKKLEEMNQIVRGLLLKLDGIISKEHDAFERELGILAGIETKNYSNASEEVEELIGTVEYIELNLHREEEIVIEPLRALIDQKRRIIERVEELRSRFEAGDELSIERIKMDLKNLNPLQAKEYLKLLQEMINHYSRKGIDFSKIKNGMVFLDRFRRAFTRRRAEIEGQKKVQEAERYEQTLELTGIDPLTGLNNRRKINEDFRIRIKFLKRNGGTLGFLIADIDMFKSINDTWGHPVGDIAIIVVAKALKEVLRAGDSAYRYGGEEFAILLSDVTNEEKLMMIGNRMRSIVNTRVEEEKRRNKEFARIGERKITICIGAICVYSSASNERLEASFIERKKKEIIDKTDQLLYTAKQNGRDQVRITGIGI